MAAPIDWQTDAAFAYRTEPPTVCSRVLRPLRLVLEERGLTSLPAIEALEVRDREGDERLHVADWYALLEDALARTANPLLGLHWAQKAATVSGTIGLVEYLLRTSRSLRGALAGLVSYGCLFQDDLAFDSVFEGTAVRLRLRSCQGSSIPPVWSEAVLAYCSFLLMSLLGSSVSPQHWVLSFAHPGPAVTDSYRRMLRASVRFGSAESALTVPAELLDRTLFTADPSLNDVLEEHARRTLVQQPCARVDIQQRVRAVLLQELDGGNPTRQHVARALRMSPRTLTRRLADAGTSFEALLSSLRRELSVRYLRESDASVGQIALALGFSGASSFTRAFRRWTGTSPQAARNESSPSDRDRQRICEPERCDRAGCAGE